MKPKKILFFAALLLMAGLFGWFLPPAVSDAYDHSIEDQPRALQIRQVDLTYRSDLSIEDRVLLLRDPATFQQTTVLTDGICLTAEQAWSIAEDFLRELTGSDAALRAETYEAIPQLFVFDDCGTFLVWQLTMEINESWYCNIMMDDQSGVILQCEFSGDADRWDSMFSDFAGEETVSEALRNALQNHFNTRLPDNYQAQVQLDPPSEGTCTGEITLTAVDRETVYIPFSIVLPMGYVAVNL